MTEFRQGEHEGREAKAGKFFGRTNKITGLAEKESPAFKIM
jgi:hypothetical protein